MRTSSRRRLDVLLLGAGAAAAAGVAAIGGIAADNERITHMWVGAGLAPDGSAEIVEVIDYDFGLAQEKHGIFRVIPGLRADAPVSVESASAPDRIDARTPEIFEGQPAMRLRIGDPDITITGRHRYRIEYPLPLGEIASPGALRWDAIGHAWEVGIVEGEVHIVAPWEMLEPTCAQGPPRSQDACAIREVAPGHLVAEVESLDAGEGVTVDAALGASLPGGAPELPAPPASAPPDPGAGLLLPAAVAAVAAGGASSASSRLVRRRGRERVGPGGAADAAWADGNAAVAGEVLVDHEDLAEMATTEVAPPEQLRPAQGGVIHAESVRPEHKVAWLIEAAIDGDVELVEEGRKRVRLVRTGPGSPERKKVLDRAFGGRSEVELGEYDATFAKAWSKLERQLDHWRRNSGLWDPAGERRVTGVRAVGIFVAVAGAVGIAFGGAFAARWGEPWLVLVGLAAALAASGLAAALRAWELRVRTPKGSGLWLRVESFRRFLAASEAFHAEEAAQRGVLREYTAWAVALGEIDRWERAVGRSSVIPAEAGIGYAHMAPVLIGATAATATAPSSSGGSGGGGGGVGGGGGGGGGGSW